MFGKPRSEIALLEASLRGSTQAFAVVVGRYQSLVCAITYSATRNVEKSEELAQEVFLRAWKSLGQLKDLGKFRPWLCSIARSTVQNWLRRQRRDIVAKAAPLDAAAEQASNQSGPEEAAITKEQQAVVNHALARIPDGVREPLILFYREHKSTREVAEQLGLSESAVRQRISRGRSLLRDQVAAMVETTIARSGPGQAFTAAVAVSLAALATKSATTTAAAMQAAPVGGGLGLTAAASGAAAKIIALAAGLAIVAGGVIAFHRLAKPPRSPKVATSAEVPMAQPSADSLPTPTTSAQTAQSEAQPNASVRESAAMDSRTSMPHVPELSNYVVPAAAPAAQAEPFEFKPKGLLSGVITDVETGQPVRDALVRISMQRGFEARTDAHGFYSLETIHEAGNYDLTVDSLEYVGISLGRRNPTVYLAGDAQVVRHFQLPRACMLELRVVDANGIGIKDARVVVTSLTDDRKQALGYLGDLRRTDPNGCLLLGGLPPAETDYLITIWHEKEKRAEQYNGGRIVRYAYDYAPAKTTVRLTEPNVVPQIRLVLERGESVHGYAEYADDVPATDVKILARPTWWHCNYGVHGCEVNDDGTFTLEHIRPGTYDVCMQITRPDFGGGVTRTVMQVPLTPGSGDPLVVQLPEKSPQSLAAISGRFLFTGDKRPTGVEIRAYAPKTGNTYITVGHEPGGEVKDTFVIDRLEPGTYRLTFSGANLEERVLENVQAPSSDLEVELVYAAKPMVDGTVVDALTRKPVKRFEVRVQKLATLRGPGYVQQDRWAHFDSERGAFSVQTVGPGVYQVQVAAEGYAPAWSESINTDEPAPVSVALSAGGAIGGVVVDEAGLPIAGVKVIPLSMAGGVTPRTQNVFASENGAVEAEDGTFMLQNLPPGQETLKVMHPDYAFRIVPEVSVAQGQITEGITVVLSKGGTIEGFVYDNQGSPQARDVLYFQDAAGYGGSGDEEAGRLATAVTDSNGFYRVEHLPEMLCYVNRPGQWSGLGVVRRAVIPRNGAVLRLNFGGEPVVVGTAVVEGLPLANARLLLAPAESPDFGVFKCFTATDDQGNFAFKGAIPGTLGVYREKTDRQDDWLKIATITVGESDADVGVIGEEISRLSVAINAPNGDPPWEIVRLFLAESGKLIGVPMNVAEPPADEGAPWVFQNVEPGLYTLTVLRRDQVQWRREITLPPGVRRWDITIDLPHATARVSGHLAGSTGAGLVLWREDRSIVAGITPADAQGYAVNALPAGRYRVGPTLSYLHGTPAIAELDLTDGEVRTLDLDLSEHVQGEMAYLLVQVVDENGSIREDAQVRLDGAFGTIEPLQSAQGMYAFLAAPGQQLLRVAAPGHSTVEKPVTLKSAELTDAVPQTILVRLEPL